MEDYYLLLSLNRSADEDTIRTAVNRELRVWSQRTNAPEIDRRQAAERKIKLLEQAEATLLDGSNRSRYDRDLPNQPTHQRTVSDPVDGSPSDAVQTLVERAAGLMRVGNYPAAISQLNKAMRLDPGNLKLQAMLADTKKEWGQILIRGNY
jgi:curved DNA-binding protein CbpA